jgi:hypothetical protein
VILNAFIARIMKYDDSSSLPVFCTMYNTVQSKTVVFRLCFLCVLRIFKRTHTPISDSVYTQYATPSFRVKCVRHQPFSSLILKSQNRSSDCLPVVKMNADCDGLKEPERSVDTSRYTSIETKENELIVQPTNTNMSLTMNSNVKGDPEESTEDETDPLLDGNDDHDDTDNDMVLNSSSQTQTNEQDGSYGCYFTSLAWAPTTPRIATWLIPLCAILTHGLFLYGQMEPMWRLTQSQSIDIWWNATSTKARWAYDTLGLPRELNLVRHDQSTIQTFTYSFAIQELWAAKGMPGTTLPRIASVLLALFSGVWPHLKLILLNLTWFLRLRPAPRTSLLHWLSCLGKWSLADILVVCVMVGVLHIDWVVDPDEIRLGISDHLPEMLHLVQTQFDATALCTQLLSNDCSHPDSISHHIQCDACITGVNTAFWKKDWAGSTGKSILNGIETSGSGICELRVIGMRGIYSFCAAVIISILLSLVVDLLDHRAQDDMTMMMMMHMQTTTTTTTQNEGQGDHLRDVEEPSATNYSLLMDEEDAPLLEGTVQSSLNLESGNVDDNADETTVRVPIRWFSCAHGFFSFLVLILSIFATSWITLERQVHGAIPMLLHQILGVEWSKSYSLRSLSATTGAAGGWDVLLMSTFSLFIVAGPVVRSSLCVLGHVLPGRLSTIQTFVDLIGAFCAWEVFVIAVAMICLLMPSITGTILMDSRCLEVDPTGSCFEVEFRVLQTFGLVLVSGVVLVLISNSFSFFARKRRQTRSSQRQRR